MREISCLVSSSCSSYVEVSLGKMLEPQAAPIGSAQVCTRTNTGEGFLLTHTLLHSHMAITYQEVCKMNSLSIQAPGTFVHYHDV